MIRTSLAGKTALSMLLLDLLTPKRYLWEACHLDDFKKYFLQFGPSGDVVVMYDHSTQRPRGFGFITFESEESVDKALFKTFHELNGKMVEVKRAVQKELSPGPVIRSPFAGYNYSSHRINSFISGFPQGLSPSSLASYGMKMDARFNPAAGERNVYPAFGAPFGMGMNLDPGFNSSFIGISNYNNNASYGRGLGAYYSGNSSRYTSAISYGAGNLGAGTGGVDLGTFDNNSISWGGTCTPRSAHDVGSNVSYAGENLGFASVEKGCDLASNAFGRSSGVGAASTFSNSFNDESGGSYTDIYGSNSVYGDPTWWPGSNDIDGHEPFGYGFDGAAPGYTDGYNVNTRQQNRGIAA
ncbi:hypothetical protein J5N97_008343 [Dioscorea zingiberensis]|uniref:RRM domain-containing protein n=1 Tax=Dioscorea zingiberensis TaxID=325984 RepID=A0A9D5HKU1_9LILI|nr:hypothetical protein J5N97_008343 [Dioscorea zingiberensis]